MASELLELTSISTFFHDLYLQSPCRWHIIIMQMIDGYCIACHLQMLSRHCQKLWKGC